MASKKLSVNNSSGRILKDASSTNNLTPVFSFKYFSDEENGISELDLENAKEFLRQLKTFSSMTWQQIQNAHRHGLGCEKIKNIEKPVPKEFDGKPLLAFRYYGKRAFIGIRVERVLELLYIDQNFHGLYSH